MKRRFRQTRKQTRKQKGGFYPSVYGGVQGATLLLPVAARQAYRLWNSRKTRRTRKLRRRS